MGNKLSWRMGSTESKVGSRDDRLQRTRIVVALLPKTLGQTPDCPASDVGTGRCPLAAILLVSHISPFSGAVVRCAACGVVAVSNVNIMDFRLQSAVFRISREAEAKHP